MEIKNLSQQYWELWNQCQSILRQGRQGDDAHAAEVAESIIDYNHRHPVDLAALIPVAILHDIGHSAILPEHFKYITGGEKLVNSKLVHMLAGAKIAKNILQSLNYDPQKTDEIVEIISIHDADQLKDVDLMKVYNTDNKKIFHDLDRLDSYNPERLKKLDFSFPDKNKMLSLLEKNLDTFFNQEIKKTAVERLKIIKNNY